MAYEFFNDMSNVHDIYTAYVTTVLVNTYIYTSATRADSAATRPGMDIVYACGSSTMQFPWSTNSTCRVTVAFPDIAFPSGVQTPSRWAVGQKDYYTYLGYRVALEDVLSACIYIQSCSLGFNQRKWRGAHISVRRWEVPAPFEDTDWMKQLKCIRRLSEPALDLYHEGGSWLLCSSFEVANINVLLDWFSDIILYITDATYLILVCSY